MFGKKNKTNYIFSIFLLIIILLFITSTIFIVTIPRQYEDYSTNYVEEIQSQVEEVIFLDDVAYEITELQNDYRFDLMVFNDGVLSYTSDDLLYDREYADEIFNDGYIFKGSYFVGDTLVWIIIYETSLSDFVNYILMKNLTLFVIQAILMITMLTLMLRKTLRPLLRLSEIINVLKTDDNLELTDELDEISEELIKVSNDLKLRLYYSKQEEKEYARMYLKQVDLLKEQKQHLTHIVHDVKGTFASINFSSHCLANTKALNESEQMALDSIESSSSAALNYITESLNQIINDSVDIYINKYEVKVKKTIEEFFEFNNMLLVEKSLTVNIEGSEKTVVLNVLKFNQIINNIISNMIKYSKNNSELKIKLKDNKCIFTNNIESGKKKYSNSFGLNAIEELTKSMGIKYEFNTKNGIATSVLHLGGGEDD